jgi:hypothetical protein
MNNPSPQQKQEAEQLYQKGLQLKKSKDYTSAASYFEKASSYGHFNALNQLALLYANGLGVAKDPQKAYSLFIKAANKGGVTAMKNVAICYLNGFGTRKDIDSAISWLETAVDYGKDALSCKKLAEIYGDLLNDSEEQINWYKKGAEYGNADSMLFLGEYYSLDGFFQDLELAEKYYKDALNAGSPEIKQQASQALDTIRPKKAPVSGGQTPAYPNVTSGDSNNLHSCGQEYYSTSISGLYPTEIAEFEGRIYYAKEEYLCSSDVRGQDIKIIAKLDKDCPTQDIHVNITGIYFFESDEYPNTNLRVQHLDFNGNVVGTFREIHKGGADAGHGLNNLFFYDNLMYLVYKHDLGRKTVSQIKCAYIDEGRVEVIYEKASSIERLLATEDKLIFYAKYENKVHNEDWRGWMILDLVFGDVECLSNPYCSAENVVDNPKVYDSESPQYNSLCRYEREIKAFDLSRNIFWTERTAHEGSGWTRYWEPHDLWGDRDALSDKMPTWKIPNEFSMASYYWWFDGVRLYFSTHYATFYSSDQFGNVYTWHDGGHGACDQFIVSGEHLYVNLDAEGVKQYRLSVDISAPTMDVEKWQHTPLSQDVIDTFKDSKRKSTVRKTQAAASNGAASENPNMAVGERSSNDLFTEKTIGETDIKYNICTFGSKFHIGFGVPITIRINNRTYPARTHTSAKGRVDGMKKIYAENDIRLGDKLSAYYTASSGIVDLRKI